MATKKKIYYAVNVLALLPAAWLFAVRAAELARVLPAPGALWAAVLGGVLCVLLAKLARFYLILLEDGISFSRFMQMYAKTSFVNLLLPFKLGELFKIYCFACETRSYYTGIFSAVVDRFFDTCALLLLLVPYELAIVGRLSFISVLLLAFVGALWLAYLVFPGTYAYLNRFTVLHVQGRGAVTALKTLGTLNECRLFVRRMVRGRAPLLLLLSLFAWGCEIATAYASAVLLGAQGGALLFEQYVAAAYRGGASGLVNVYTAAAALLLCVLLLASYLRRKDTAHGKISSGL